MAMRSRGACAGLAIRPLRLWYPSRGTTTFSKDSRADPALTPVTGIGLGLAIARTILEAHHGRIEALSAGEAETILRVVLPAVLSSPAPVRAGCLWTATSNVPWLAISSGATGGGAAQAARLIQSRQIPVARALVPYNCWSDLHSHSSRDLRKFVGQSWGIPELACG